MSDRLEDIVADMEKRANILHQAKAYGQGFLRGGRNQAEFRKEQEALKKLLAEQSARAPIETPAVPGMSASARAKVMAGDRKATLAQRKELEATRKALNRPAPLGRIEEARAAELSTRAADAAAKSLQKLQREEARQIADIERMRGKGVSVPAITPQYAGMLPHEYVASQGLAVPAHLQPKPPPAPAPAQQAAPAARATAAAPAARATAAAPAAAAPAAAAPAAPETEAPSLVREFVPARRTKKAPAVVDEKPGLFQRYAPPVLGTAGLAAGGYALYNAMTPAEEQTERSMNHMVNARQGELGAMPSMTVTASYEKFAQEKLASTSPMPSSNPMLFASAPAAFAKSLTDTLGAKLVADPIDALHATIKKRYYDEPKWQQNFDDVVKGDPMLSRAHTENPAMLEDAFSSVKRFSPTLAKDRLATRNLLRHVVMSGGEMDHSVMKMLAETEQAVTKSKGR